MNVARQSPKLQKEALRHVNNHLRHIERSLLAGAREQIREKRLARANHVRVVRGKKLIPRPENGLLCQICLEAPYVEPGKVCANCEVIKKIIEADYFRFRRAFENLQAAQQPRNLWACKDCGRTDSFTYMLKPEIWEKAWPDFAAYNQTKRPDGWRNRAILCITCVDLRLKALGYVLSSDDFMETPCCNEVIHVVARNLKDQKATVSSHHEND